MKLHIVSDLHLDFYPFELPEVQADILVLAGDIAPGLVGLDYASKYAHRYKHVFYIPGNHEFYGHHLSRLSMQMQEFCKGTNIVLFDSTVFETEDIMFIGTTLWTDFCLYGNSLEQIVPAMRHGAMNLQDFSQIRYASFWFNPSQCASLSLTAQEFIKKYLELENNKKKVVLTHHTPSIKSVPEKFANDPLNPCFSNNLDSLAAQADMWIHGHTHDSFDYCIEKCRVICNPRGYTKNPTKQENLNFNPQLVIEI